MSTLWLPHYFLISVATININILFYLLGIFDNYHIENKILFFDLISGDNGNDNINLIP